MASLPTIVYRSPGPHAGEYGRTYESKGVTTAEALDEAHKAGWRDSVAEACQPPAPAAEAPEPTDRALLEAKATDLGIQFASSWSDRKLSDRIAAALKG